MANPKETLTPGKEQPDTGKIYREALARLIERVFKDATDEQQRGIALANLLASPKARVIQADQLISGQMTLTGILK